MMLPPFYTYENRQLVSGKMDCVVLLYQTASPKRFWKELMS